MPVARLLYNKFNRGLVDQALLARDDVEKINNSSRQMKNWLPLRAGPMMRRPGIQDVYLLNQAGNPKDPENWAEYFMVPFVRSIEDRAILMFQGQFLRILPLDQDDNVTELGTSKPFLTTSFTNLGFVSNITGWTDGSGGSATTGHSADYGGCAVLTGTDTSQAVLHQTSSSTDVDLVHVYRVVVRESPVTIRIGTSGANSTDIYEGSLGVGHHILSFTPTTAFTLTFANSKSYRTCVESIELLEVPNVYRFNFLSIAGLEGLASANLQRTAYDQSGDIMFFAGGGFPPFQIERRSPSSWSVVLSQPDDGPFGSINNTDITLTPSALSGNPTLTASRAYFKATDVGQLFRLVSAGQRRQTSVSAADAGTGSIKVGGSGTSRSFIVFVSGTFSATATLQRSVDEVSWEDVESYTGYTYKTFTDGLDGGVYFYRLRVKTGNYTSGTVVLNLDYPSGSIEGTCRVTKFTSSTVVSIAVLEPFGATTATRDWYRSQWGVTQGFPSALALFEGRLWYAGRGQVWGSVSDNYTSFDRQLEGGSASIYRTIGFGPTDQISWIKGTLGLVLAIETDEISIRSSAYGEILTNATVNLRSGSTEGAADIQPQRADRTLYYVHRSGGRLYALEHQDVETFVTLDQNKLTPRLCSEGIRRLAVVRQPETRVWCLLEDGVIAVQNIDMTEDMRAWSIITVDPSLTPNDIIAVPGKEEDRLFVTVTNDAKNTVSLCRIGKMTEATEITTDGHYSIGPVTGGTPVAITRNLTPNAAALDVWADGKFMGAYTSPMTLPSGNYTDVYVGMRYEAVYESNKLLGFTAQGYPTFGTRRRITHMGLVAADLYPSLLTYSGDGSNFYPLPAIEEGTTYNQDAILAEYDEPLFEFPGGSETDARVFVKTHGPATILAIVYAVEYPDDSPSP